MWKKVLHFVQYNNAFVLIIALFFSGTAATFAANPDARASIYSSSQQVISVDNTFLLAQNLDTYSFNVRITAVTEDEDTYYVEYTYKTMEVANYVWQDIEHKDTMKVAKKEILGKDLGTYVANQLSQVANTMLVQLKDTQKDQKHIGATYKTVTTEYSGLIGRMLNPDTEEFPGYTPIIVELPPASQADVLASLVVPSKPYLEPGSLVDSNATSSDEVVHVNSSGYPGMDPNDVAAQVTYALNSNTISTPENPIEGAPVIVIQGNNPAVVNVGSSYLDLGALVTDDKDKNLSANVAGDQVNTSAEGTFKVNYSVTDTDGHTTVASRVVNVVKDPNLYTGDSSPTQTPVSPNPTPTVPDTTGSSSSTPAQPDQSPVDPVKTPAPDTASSTPVVVPAPDTATSSPDVPVPPVQNTEGTAGSPEGDVAATSTSSTP
jgi:hypothetical protein